MLAGTKKVTRYYTYNNWAFNITRDNIINYGVTEHTDKFKTLPPGNKKKAKLAKTHSDLFEAAGSIPFYQILPVGSLLNPGTLLNGTRLTLHRGTKEGWDFSIVSATAPERTSQYHIEMSEAYLHVEQSLLAYYTLLKSGTASEESLFASKENVIRRSASLYYYWVNFAPLTRGTSATGYAILLGIILSLGEEPAGERQKGKRTSGGIKQARKEEERKIWKRGRKVEKWKNGRRRGRKQGRKKGRKVGRGRRVSKEGRNVE